MWGLPGACRLVCHCPCIASSLFTDRAPFPHGLLTSALCSIPPVVHSLTCFALRCGLAGRLGIASPSSGRLPEACLLTPRSGVVRFHSPQTLTQTVWTVTPGVVFGRPRLGTVVKQQRKRTGWAPRKLQRPTPRPWSRAYGPSPPVLVVLPSLTHSLLSLSPAVLFITSLPHASPVSR